MKNEFLGNEICCGSYACLNAIKNPDIPLKLFEISTSVPFGVKHIKNEFFDHLLTTYCDPNIGIDKAVPLWGYKQKKELFLNKEEAFGYLKKEVSRNPVVLGPIDMGCLYYLPVSYMYRRMDHYIVLLEKKGKICCEDSEGIFGIELTDEQILSLISVDKLLESGGLISVRSFYQIKDFNMNEILEQSMLYALENLNNAEKEGQGSGAFLDCYDYLENQDIRLWKLPLLYDINYLIQRKLLFIKLLQESEIYFGWKPGIEVVEKQRAILVDMFGKLRKYNRIFKKDFECLAGLESEFCSWEYV